MKMLRGRFLPHRNTYLFESEPSIFHCHHYNCYLQAVILDAGGYLPGLKDILVESSQEVVYAQFKRFFRTNSPMSVTERKEVIEDYFRYSGFGLIDLDNVSQTGGVVETAFDHYGIGWKVKFGKSSEPVSFFTCGFLAGALEAIYDLEQGTINCEQIQCISSCEGTSKFVLRKAAFPKFLHNSPAEGVYQNGVLRQARHSSVDYNAVRNALVNMPFEGSKSNGLIEAFGVYLTRHYANYYCNISYKFLHLFKNRIGSEGFSIATELLTEAGQVCGFNTFGGIMQSNEWNAMIKPMLSNKEDWVHGIVAVVNAFGWGFWEIVELDPGKKLLVKIVNGYEANSFIKGYGKSTFPVSFLATGGVAGVM
ncbi:MAG: hypothetical protein ACOYXT_00495, partial [Bacteroidota bacterium]